MELIQLATEKEVTDYDFLFTGGVKFPVTLDEGAGDSVVEEGDRFKVYLSEKPRPTDPEVMMSAETVYVYKPNLIALVVRTRKQRLPNPEELLEFKNTLHGLSKTVQ